MKQEELEQTFLFRWALMNQSRYPELRLLLHVPNGRLSKEQEYWLNELSKEGYQTAVCRSWVDAAKVIIAYLDLPIEL